jgi:hypothetical protein
VHFHDDVQDPVFTLELRNSSRVTAFAVSSAISHGPVGRIGAGTTLVLRLRFENSLAPGPYSLTASVGHLEDELMHPYDLREGIASILVQATGSGGGVADLPHTVTISRE